MQGFTGACDVEGRLRLDAGECSVPMMCLLRAKLNRGLSPTISFALFAWSYVFEL
jgi:hypothetical protein